MITSSPARPALDRLRASDAVAAMGIDASHAPRMLARVVALALAYPRRFAAAMAACAGAALANLLLPWLLGRVVDEAAALARVAAPLRHGQSLAPVAWAAGCLVLASALRGLLQMAAGYNAEHVGQSVGRDLRLAFFEKLQRLDLAFHDAIHSGDLITRGMLDLEGVRGFIEVGLQRIVQLALLAGIGGWRLIATDPVLGTTTLIFLPFVAVMAGAMGLKLRYAWTRLQERMADLTRVMEENLQGARVVRAFPARDHQIAAFDAAGNAALALANQRIAIRSRAMAQINLVFYGAMALVLAVGSWRIGQGALTIGDLAAFLAYMTILQMPVRQVGMIANAAARAVSSGTRLFDILDRQPAVADAPGARPLALEQGTLVLDRVSFRYAVDAPDALHDISLTVRRGQTLGIVGPAGSGKSTLAQLIGRFHDVTEGSVRIDGHDVRDVTLASLREAVGLVAQEAFLFDDSVERNIAYADPRARRGDVHAAAQVAQLHDHVAGLPRGYLTGVGERGSRLSGGQRQRATIARGLLPDPAILIFDDATSAVDAATEHRLRHALREAARDKTTVIIAHRLSSLMHADEIIVLDHGRIVERGRHADLVAAGGHYARLHALQTNPGARADEERMSA